MQVSHPIKLVKMLPVRDSRVEGPRRPVHKRYSGDVTQIPPENLSPRWADDDRVEPPWLGSEREIPTGRLDWYRRTFELKCGGVPPERLSERAVPPSTMSLHDLVRHLAAVERWWFRLQFAGENVPMLYYSDEDPD
jgi:hypothetical protein